MTNLPFEIDRGHKARAYMPTLTTDACDADAILAPFAREGWKAERVYNGPPNAGFGLVRCWIENHTTIEIGGREMREEYERFFREATKRK